MSCSREEIAEKRRLAQEKLRQSKSSVCVSTNSFYGPQKNVLSEYQNKIKATSPYKNARILSQPYTNNNTTSGRRQSKETETNKASTSAVCAPIFDKNFCTCTCSLISANRFVVIPSTFHSQLIDVFKTIPSKLYS